jgi:hypothetical protein
MSRFCMLLLTVLCAFGQDPTATSSPEPPKPVLNIFIDRAGFMRDLNYGYAEWFQIRGTKHPKWSIIAPDVGIIFFDNAGRYREFFVGAGIEVQPTAALTIDHEAYFEQATGIDSHGKSWYVPWTRVGYHFPKKFVSEVVFFPYVPLNGGTKQFILERSKLEYTGFKHFNFGGGYGAYQDFTFTHWQSKPFATMTLKTAHLGNFEFWVQAFPHDGMQIQYRHAFAWRSRH